MRGEQQQKTALICFGLSAFVSQGGSLSYSSLNLYAASFTVSGEITSLI